MTKQYFQLLAFFVLSILHVPLIYFGDPYDKAGRDSIGLFDFATVALCVVYLRTLISGRPFRADQPTLLFCLFLILALISYLINYIYSDRFSTFGMLVILKNTQYVFVFYFFLLMARRLSIHQVASIVAIGAALFTIIGIVNIATGHGYRLGFMWKEGESPSQPAGYFLGICMLFLFFYLKMYSTRRAPLYAGVLLLLWVGLFLTFSRTNNLAFLFCLGPIMLYKTSPLRAYLTGVSALVLTVGLSTVFADLAYKEPITAYLFDPSLILEDPSFIKRYSENGLWFDGLRYMWENPLNIWLGVGFGTVRVADGLLLQLFYSSGVIGTTVYLSFFMYALYRYRNFFFAVFVLFLVLNSIGSDGVLFAFRGVMPSLLIWAALIHFGCRDPLRRRGGVVALPPLSRPDSTAWRRRDERQVPDSPA